MKAVSNSSTGIVLLAAGESSRMSGRPKQLLLFRGQSLIRRAAKIALATKCQMIVIVLGANAELLQTEVEDLPLQIVINPNWADGMSSSIKIGLSVLLAQNPELEAVVIMLCDQPLITPKIINRLIEVYGQTKKPLVAARYSDATGVPALFAREMFEELLNLAGDVGAKFVIKKYANAVEKVSIPEAAFDVDTREDYEKLQAVNDPL